MSLILMPKLVPPGGFLPEPGEVPKAPRCQRCLREGTAENYISLQERPTWTQKGPFLRKDALCLECRRILKS